MKQIRTYRIFASYLVLMLLVATTGVTMNKHYCMGRVKSIAFFEEADNCAKIIGLEEGEADPMGCCDDETVEIKVNELQKVSFEFQVAAPSVVAQIFHFTALGTPLFGYNPVVYLKYKPPLLDHDIPVLIQSFLV